MFKYIFGLVLAFMPTLAFAAEEGGVEPHMGWRVIDFVLFVAILYYFLRKPVAEFFKTRKESIKRELEEAEQLKEEAERLFEETKKKLERLEDEIKNLLETYESMAKNERNQILKEVEKAINRILASIEEEKASILSKAKMLLLKKMSKEAMENLRRRFENLTLEEHAKINDKFIRSLQQ